MKNQCSGDYFYGEDGKLEIAIQSMEQGYSEVLRKVTGSNYNKLQDDDELILKRFWLFQYMRTEAASKRMVEMNNNLGDLVGAGHSFRLEVKEAVVEGMATFADMMNITDDLRGCLLKVKSDVPVITSDDPAVLTNRWFKSDRRLQGSGFGLGSAGIVAILPLSTDMVFVAYDPDVYAIAKKDGIFKVKRTADVNALNQLQLLNCRANIFPGDSYDDQSLINEFRSCRHNRLESRHVLHYSVLDGRDGEYKRYRVVEGPSEEGHEEALVHSQAVFPSPTIWPSFLGWRRKGFGMANGTGVGCIRQSQTVERGGPPYSKQYTRH